MFARALQKDHHERRFTIVQNGRYWEVLEERDRLVVRRAIYDDWHRVERAKRVFAQEIESLCQDGWVDDQPARGSARLES